MAYKNIRLEIGHILDIKYKVVDYLGEPGGFGVTYKVYDIDIEKNLDEKRYHAIKEYFPTAILTLTMLQKETYSKKVYLIIK